MPEHQLGDKHHQHANLEHPLHLSALLGIDDERHHADEGDQHGDQISLPLAVAGQAGALQQRRQRHEARHQQGVHAEDAEVELEQARVGQHGAHPPLHHAGLAIEQVSSRSWHQPEGDGDACQCQQGDQPEQTTEPQRMGDEGAGHHGDGEGDAKAHPDEGHRLGAVLLAGEIRQERHHGSRDGAAALQGAAEDHAPDGVGQRRDHAAEGKHQQTADDEGLAAHLVGEQTERDLEQRLGHAVDADGQANQRLGGTRERHAVGGQYRQHHKHAEHAQREDGAERPGGTALAPRHGEIIHDGLDRSGKRKTQGVADSWLATPDRGEKCPTGRPHNNRAGKVPGSGFHAF